MVQVTDKREKRYTELESGEGSNETRKMYLSSEHNFEPFHLPSSPLRRSLWLSKIQIQRGSSYQRAILEA